MARPSARSATLHDAEPSTAVQKLARCRRHVPRGPSRRSRGLCLLQRTRLRGQSTLSKLSCTRQKLYQDMKAYGCTMTLQLLGKTIAETRKASNMHADRKICALNMRRRHPFQIRSAVTNPLCDERVIYSNVLKRREDAGNPLSYKENPELARHYGVKPKFKPCPPLWLPIPKHSERKDKLW